MISLIPGISPGLAGRIPSYLIDNTRKLNPSRQERVQEMDHGKRAARERAEGKIREERWERGHGSVLIRKKRTKLLPTTVGGVMRALYARKKA